MSERPIWISAPVSNSCATCPSAVTTRSFVRSIGLTATRWVAAITKGRMASVCGQMGVTIKQSTEGTTIGPPADSE